MLLVCKQCGNKEKARHLHECEEFTVTQEADPLQPTVCTCNNCGNSGALSNFVVETKIASQGVGGKTQDASDMVEDAVDSTETRNVQKKNRKRPEKRIMHNDSEQVRETVAMSNPFVKSAQFSDLESPSQAVKDGQVIAVWSHPKDPKKMFKQTTGGGGMQFTEDGGMTWEFTMRTPEEIDRQGYVKKKGPEADDTEEREQMGFDNEEEWQDMKNNFASNNPFLKRAEIENNPFVKVAREFKRSPWGQYMKGLSEDNMAFPEDPPGKGKNSGKEKKKDSGKEGAGDTYGGTVGMSTKDDDEFSTYDFNPVDRKEYRSSPKRRDLEPGAAAWEDKEVDKYYDGWVSDHIRNSGGKVIGSNTPVENIMNLDDGQREKGLGNRDMIYERLLEGRHNFNDDYTFVEVADQKYSISKEAARRIVASRLTAEDEETFVSQAALDLILKKASGDCGCGGDCKDCNDKYKEATSKKKTLSKKASKFPLQSILI